VSVFDRLDTPGGRARVFRQNGFAFDAGPTVITAPFLLEELWTIAGRRFEESIDLRPVTPFYRVRFDDGEIFNYTGTAAAMRDEVARFSPDDVRGYEAFVRRSEEIFRVGFEQLAHLPFNSPWDMMRIVPQMMRLESYRTVYGLVAKHVKHPKLRQVLSFHPLLVGGNPFSTTSIYSLIAFLERKWGVHFPMGGTGSLVGGLVDLIEGLGGEVHLGEAVTEIAVEGGRATGLRLGSGRTVAADVVVSNADAAWTYRHLIPASARRTWTDRRIERSRFSMGLFVWYFGTRRTYPDVVHHTILLGPRYKELLADIFRHKRLADDFSLYLHRISRAA
jgi:phytoene desaturase